MRDVGKQGVTTGNVEETLAEIRKNLMDRRQEYVNHMEQLSLELEDYQTAVYRIESFLQMDAPTQETTMIRK